MSCGLILIISGGVGYMIVLSQGGSFLGLMVFLVYLGDNGTIALATEQYPEMQVSSMII